MSHPAELEGSVESTPEGGTISREAKWRQVAAEMEEMTDGKGLPLDEGIKEPVVALNCLGFQTDMSCFGHTDRNTGGPYVTISNPELGKLYDDSRPAAKREQEHYQKTGQDLNDPEVLAYRKASREQTDAIAAKLQPLVDDFNTATDGHLVLGRRSLNGVHIGLAGIEAGEPAPDLTAAQEEMARFGQFARNRFLAGLE